MNNLFNIGSFVKSISGTTQHQKTIVRSVIVAIVIASFYFVLTSIFVHMPSAKNYDKIIENGSVIDTKILSLDIHIDKMNNDMVKTRKIISNNKLFHSLNDISIFIDHVSMKIEQVGYLVQFKVVNTHLDNKYGIYKTVVKFEFVNINSNGKGYHKIMNALNKILTNSNKKVNVSTFNIIGNMNDIGKVEVRLNLWCDFKYGN